ncbi:MAG: hypothetical protein NTW25_13045 [Candidatus Kapabacteria bacterium]|nr:hypothetical protein [Candidatus Kapabacteria bacterium]
MEDGIKVIKETSPDLVFLDIKFKDGIEIYSTITSDCCVEIESSWYADPTGMSVEFEQMNSSGNYVYVGSSGLPAKHKFCPNPGETVVRYRLKWFNLEHKPACHDEVFQEGVDMFTRTFDLSCCGCPTNINDWLVVSSKKSNICPDNGCSYDYNLTIPESYNCFTSYKLDNGQTTNITNKVITGNGCIPANSSKSIKFKLLKANGDSCVISKDVTCAAKRDSNALPTPCMPDCFNIPWTITREFKIVNGCQGYVIYAYRNACGSQDLEIIKMEYDPNCLNNSTVESIYKNLLYKIIKNNNMGFEPLESGCATTWRIIQSACYSYYYLYTITAPNPYGPDADDCCKKTIVKNANGNWVVTDTWSSQDPDCATAGCFDTCNDTYYKKSIFEKDNKSNLDYKLTLNSNSSNDLIDVIINFEYKGSMNLIVSDLNGNLILDSKFENPKSNSLLISIGKSIQSGVYLYKLILDDGKILSGKFVKTN